MKLTADLFLFGPSPALPIVGPPTKSSVQPLDRRNDYTPAKQEA
ncbi:MAG: hypothetical protein U0136_07805 [Bdellovibrionota bacterium]